MGPTPRALNPQPLTWNFLVAKTRSRPTEAELEILTVLWSRGPSTVRQVHDALGRRTGYTTVLKLLQIMAEKDLVRRDKTERTHVYESKTSAEKMQRRLVKDLIDRAFGGSAKSLLMQALAAQRVSREELAEMNQIIEQHRADQQ